jgi:hypothetical protein
MTLREQMAADAALFVGLAEFGEAVTWQPAGGDPLAEPVAVEFHRGAMVVGGQLVAVETEATVLVPAAAIPAPAAGARFTRADGTVWTVDKSGVRGGDGVFWKLACHRDPLPTLRSW